MQYEDNILHIVKGDDLILAVNIMQPNGTEYEVQPTDRIVFTMKKDPAVDNSSLAKKNSLGFTGNTNVISISRADTIDLKPGYYFYDVRLAVCQNPDYATEHEDPVYLVTTIIPYSTAVVIEAMHPLKIDWNPDEAQGGENNE